MQSYFHTALPNSPHSWPTSARHLLPNVSVAGLKILILAWLLLFIMQIVCFPFSSFQPPLLPPPGLNSSTQNIRHSTNKCIQTRAEIHPDVLNCVATFWLHFGTHFGSTLAPFFVKMSQPKSSPLAFFLPCSIFGPRARQSEPLVDPLWTPTAPQTTPK